MLTHVHRTAGIQQRYSLTPLDHSILAICINYGLCTDWRIPDCIYPPIPIEAHFLSFSSMTSPCFSLKYFRSLSSAL